MNEFMRKLFKPKSVALVGATDREGAFGWFAAKGLMESAEHLRYYFVNQRKEELFGVKAYSDLSMLPEVPELILVAIPALAVNPLLEEAGELGIKAAIVYSSGFSEDHRCGGVELEKKLIEIAQKYDMKIIGPNCVGIINNVDKIKLWGSTGKIDMKTRATGMAVLAQSGGYTIGGVDRQQIDLSYAISSGNGNIVPIEELAEFCVEDPDVCGVCIYLEGVKKPEIFCRMLKKAAEKEKPVIILKSGRSKKGAISAASHTGNLAGANEVFDALFHKYGVITADTAEQYFGLVQTVSILKGKLPRHNRFAIINRSGGETTMSADLSERYGLYLPDLSEKVQDELNEILPAFATAKNPLDMTADVLGDAQKLRTLFEKIASDPNIDAIIAGFDFEDIPAETGYDMNAFMGEPLIEYRKKQDALPLFMIPQYESKRSPMWIMKLKEAGIPILPPGEIGYSVIEKLIQKMEYDPKRKRLESAVPNRKGEADVLTEYESKKELARYGLPIPEQWVVRNEAELEAACEKVGFPVVLKIHSKDILHKTEAGGVKLNLCSMEEAKAAYHDIMAKCAAYDPKAELNGVLVTKMIKPGVEIILGVKNDSQFGPMLLCGLGGVFVEVFKDTVLTPCPLSKEEALDQLKCLKAYKLLRGYRGSAPCDVRALAGLMQQISEYAVKNKDILEEMDINPVFVYPEGEGVSIVDAVIIKEPVD
ncbi:acetate--CoA ligase family protein [Faecalicatena acetigenes]|uniref:Acetate--CoA ligase family protein n=1 Tax=Faecalicatena acetigenes TaxID=2981790 RepID=A0ABT2T807_9FIRM|nr:MULTISPECIES: acetate--CoA ligase family protein [Lachnospiraceae]MCU6746402.1 acetate--CoA ligase family protein [Faecalicatena acetigenes]SCH16451.1 succinyl-CoA synthetase subunit beta [uncultured Clostridium sp.]